jgi:hypothetical protein
MTKSFSRTEGRPISGKPAAVPTPVYDLERTREIVPMEPSQDDEEATATPPTAAPKQAIAPEKTVPVQSCIERTLLHELLRRESAEDADEEQAEDSEVNEGD